MTEPHRIDVHHHILPPKYLAGARDVVGPVVGRIPEETWTPARALEMMDRNAIQTSLVSISAPGVWFGDFEQSRGLARDCNEFMAGLKQRYKGRFGGFASLPLGDVDASLKEIERSLDCLYLDGIGLMTNCRGKYPGDPEYAPVFEELNRRGASVFFHPTSPDCCPSISGVKDSFLEYPTDTARAILSLIFSGTVSRFPRINFIFSHGGGTLPLVWGRIINALGRSEMEDTRRRIGGDIAELLRSLYYDTATLSSAESLVAVRNLVPISQILFGTDYPFMPAEAAVKASKIFHLTERELQAIERTNALRLFENATRS